MPDFTDAAPSNWKHNFSPAGVFRDYSAAEESFELAAPGKVRHWGEVFFFDSPVRAKVSAERAGDFVSLCITVSTYVSVSCSRCLEQTRVAINGNLRYLFSLRPYSDSEALQETTDAGEEEFLAVSSWDEAINLGELAWEVLITALPSAVLCSEDCCGLCPECGTSLNKTSCGCKRGTGDPRFEALKSLLDDEA